MRINHNIAALNTHRQMGQANQAQQDSMEKLSSGLRINRAGDDAAGLAISEKMRGQIRGLDMAQKNAQDGISLIQTAEGALNESHSILQRMRELSVQSANDTNVGVDRQELQKEVNQLAEEVSRIADTTEFNTQNLLDGEFEGTFQIGANEGQNIEMSIGDMGASELEVGVEEDVAGALSSGSTDALSADATYNVLRFEEEQSTSGGSGYNFGLEDSNGEIVAVSTNGNSYTALSGASSLEDLGSTAEGASGSITFSGNVTTGTVTTSEADGSGNIDVTAAGGVDISTQQTADAAIETINAAIETVSAQRSELGAYQNRLDHTINNLGTSSENLTAAESRIRDVDMAAEMMNQTKSSILSQASQSMLAQANQRPQGVLQLLQ